MPVSTRSQIKITPGDQNEPSQEQEETNNIGLSLRNPHHGLKEKMKALTLLYEQQKQACAALRNPPPEELPRFLTHPSVELVNSTKREEEKKKKKEETKEPKQSHVMRENAMPKPNSTVTRTYVLPHPPVEDGKENTAAAASGGGGDRIVGFSCPRKASVSTTVARKLSMGSSVEPRGARNGEERESACGSRILVFVRLRPMGKKEREAGSRCCVRIVNRRDVYLSEFATENDYLRLKRLRGRHFTFDAAFPDSTSQQEVYSTTYVSLISLLGSQNNTLFARVL